MSSALSRDTHGQSPALSAAGAARRGRPRARASRGTGQNSNSPSPRVPVPGSRRSTGPTTSDTSRTSQVESGLLVAGRLPPGHDVLGGVHAAAHGRSSKKSHPTCPVSVCPSGFFDLEIFTPFLLNRPSQLSRETAHFLDLSDPFLVTQFHFFLRIPL